MAKKVSSRSTKADIIEAFKELEAAHKQLENQKISVRTIPAATTETQSISTPLKTKTIKAAQPLAINSNAQAPMEEMIELLGQLGEKFNTALSQLSTNLLVEASNLKDVRTDVDDESSRLATLYNLEVEENSLGDLLKQYSDTAKQYQEALKQKREEAENAWFEKNQAWQTEKEETEQRLQEKKIADEKTHQREDGKYRYDLTLKRDIGEEDDTLLRKKQQLSSDELEETRRKAWAEHEKVLAEREKQFEEYKNKVERFPKELETAIKKSKDEGTGIARHQAKIKADLVAKEFSGDEEVYQLKIRGLEEKVATQSTQIDKLSKQLEAALKQAQELAVKAIEGTSSHGSFEALKEIALEQAKNQPKAK
jgi:hypothetical protein